MAHFAELDDNNIVLRVIVVDDGDAPSETTGIFNLKLIHGDSTNWKQCSYNTRENTHQNGKTPFRWRFPGIGYTYNESLDAFIYPRPENPHTGVAYASWTINTTTKIWEPPVAPRAGYEESLNQGFVEYWEDGRGVYEIGIWNEDDKKWMYMSPNTKKLYPSMIWNYTTKSWNYPIAFPDDGKDYVWNESLKRWDEV